MYLCFVLQCTLVETQIVLWIIWNCEGKSDIFVPDQSEMNRPYCVLHACWGADWSQTFIFLFMVVTKVRFPTQFIPRIIHCVLLWFGTSWFYLYPLVSGLLYWQPHRMGHGQHLNLKMDIDGTGAILWLSHCQWTGIILCMCPANERQYYNVTSSHWLSACTKPGAQNNPWMRQHEKYC